MPPPTAADGAHPADGVALERLKDEFISTVSHELRTPLTSIKGTLALVLAGVVGEVPTAVRDLLDVAQANTDRLIRLVNDILDLERLVEGRIELHLDVVDTATVVGDAIAQVAPLAAEAAVTVVADPGVHRIEVDHGRVVQTLANLLDNAVRSCDPGGRVTVTARADTVASVFEVADDGRGIPAELHERIFDRFAQVDASDRRAQRGTGLGLPIARGLAERHGGTLTVASEVGVGSTFRLTLPRAFTSDPSQVGVASGGAGRGMADRAVPPGTADDDEERGR